MFVLLTLCCCLQIFLNGIEAASINILGGAASSGSSSRTHSSTRRQKTRIYNVFNPVNRVDAIARLNKTDPQELKRLIANHPGAYLYALLMSKYNMDILPVNTTRSAVQVKFLLKLTQIVDVDEKSQIMTTNVWLRHEWHDSGLKWDPNKYGGIEMLYIPADEIWLPDTILYNNADGDYHITVQTKVEVRYDGHVIWEPPAIYKSFCAIDVEFFPYDTQVCELKFGPWTEDVSKLDYYLMSSEGETSEASDSAVDMSGFYESVEWDVMEISGFRRVFRYPCCVEQYVDLTYNFHIRRKTLFYTINLIIPCVMISFVTVLVFYLPCQSGEKIALSVSTLLSLTWFILLLSEIIPPTSLALPLMGKYLLFTMVLVTLSIAITVLILYNHFRHPYTYTMPYWVRYVFLDVLPKLMFFQTIFNDQQLKKTVDEELQTQTKPQAKRLLRHSRNSLVYNRLLQYNDKENFSEEIIFSNATTAHANSPTFGIQQASPVSPVIKRKNGQLFNKNFMRMRYGALLSCHEEGEFLIKKALPALDKYMDLPEVKEAIKCVHFISRRYRISNIDARMKGDWEAVSRVLDRLFLIIFSAASALGTLAILLKAPSLYDETPAMGASDPREVLIGNQGSTYFAYSNYTLPP